MKQRLYKYSETKLQKKNDYYTNKTRTSFIYEIESIGVTLPNKKEKWFAAYHTEPGSRSKPSMNRIVL